MRWVQIEKKPHPLKAKERGTESTYIDAY